MSQQQLVSSVTQPSDILKLLKHSIFQLIGLRSVVAEHTQAEETLLQKHAKGLDFLFIDGDHIYEGCLQDWHEWSPLIVEGGIVTFHDAKLFTDGWTEADWGPVRVVNELFFDNNNPGWQLVDAIDSTVVFQKTKSLGR